jgi:hypothetical protein
MFNIDVPVNVCPEIVLIEPLNVTSKLIGNTISETTV